MQMHQSRAFTMAVPQVADTDGDGTPFLIAKAARVPLRVLVRNVGFGTTVYVGYTAEPLQSFPVSDAFELPAGASEVFVLAPEQELRCASPGVGARLAIAISDALPDRT